MRSRFASTLLLASIAGLIVKHFYGFLAGWILMAGIALAGLLWRSSNA